MNAYRIRPRDVRPHEAHAHLPCYFCERPRPFAATLFRHALGAGSVGVVDVACPDCEPCIDGLLAHSRVGGPEGEADRLMAAGADLWAFYARYQPGTRARDIRHMARHAAHQAGYRHHTHRGAARLVYRGMQLADSGRRR